MTNRPATQGKKGKATALDAEIGAKIRALRESHEISQTDLAAELGITFQQIQKYEAGSNRVSASRLFDIAQIFGVSLLEFFPGTPATSSLVQRQAEEIEKLRGVIGWHSQNLKDCLKKGALAK